MTRDRPGPYIEKPCNLLVVYTGIQDEDKGIVYHKVIKIEDDGSIMDSLRIFEQIRHPWETDHEMKRIA